MGRPVPELEKVLSGAEQINAIALSIGLNGLQTDGIDRENDKRTSTYKGYFLVKSSQLVTHVFSSLGVAAMPTQL